MISSRLPSGELSKEFWGQPTRDRSEGPGLETEWEGRPRFLETSWSGTGGITLYKKAVCTPDFFWSGRRKNYLGNRNVKNLG